MRVLETTNNSFAENQSRQMNFPKETELKVKN